MTTIKAGDEDREDREFEARSALRDRGIFLEACRSFTLEQIEALELASRTFTTPDAEG